MNIVSKAQLTPSGTPTATCTRRRYLSESTNLKQDMSWINARWKYFQTFQARCVGSSDCEMRTRVIDLGVAGEKAMPKHLVSGGQFAKSMALSYCWGDRVKHEIKPQNLKYTVMLSSIDEQRMSKPHRDTFELARRLGFPFMWINAICIIKDSGRDWEIESSRMFQVFGNAELTLVVGRTSDSTSGFLENSHAPELAPYRIEYPTRVHLRTHTASVTFLHLRSLEVGPLDDRAWCLRETIP